MAAIGHTENPNVGVYDTILTCIASNPTKFGVRSTFQVSTSPCGIIFTFNCQIDRVFYIRIICITLFPLRCSP